MPARRAAEKRPPQRSVRPGRPWPLAALYLAAALCALLALVACFTGPLFIFLVGGFVLPQTGNVGLGILVLLIICAPLLCLLAALVLETATAVALSGRHARAKQALACLIVHGSAMAFSVLPVVLLLGALYKGDSWAVWLFCLAVGAGFLFCLAGYIGLRRNKME